MKIWSTLANMGTARLIAYQEDDEPQYEICTPWGKARLSRSELEQLYLFLDKMYSGNNYKLEVADGLGSVYYFRTRYEAEQAAERMKEGGHETKILCV